MRSPVSYTARQLQAFSIADFVRDALFLFCGHSFHSFDVLHALATFRPVSACQPSLRARRFRPRGLVLVNLLHPACVETGRLAMRFKIASSSARSARSFSPDC